MKDFFYLGLITKPFGYKGQLFVYLDTDEPEKYRQLGAVFLNIDGEMLPYIIEEFQYRGTQQAVVKFADVDGNEAKNLIKTELYLPLSYLPPLMGNKFYYHEIIGFDVIDRKKENIGKCLGFLDFSQQPIMQVDFNGKEILIPAIDQIFDTVDREGRIIYIQAPEGLIDLYLND